MEHREPANEEVLCSLEDALARHHVAGRDDVDLLKRANQVRIGLPRDSTDICTIQRAGFWHSFLLRSGKQAKNRRSVRVVSIPCGLGRERCPACEEGPKATPSSRLSQPHLPEQRHTQHRHTRSYVHAFKYKNRNKDKRKKMNKHEQEQEQECQTCTSSTSSAMHEQLWSGRDVVVDDVIEQRDIQPARCDICHHQRLDFALLETGMPRPESQRLISTRSNPKPQTLNLNMS